MVHLHFLSRSPLGPQTQSNCLLSRSWPADQPAYAGIFPAVFNLSQRRSNSNYMNREWSGRPKVTRLLPASTIPLLAVNPPANLLRIDPISATFTSLLKKNPFWVVTVTSGIPMNRFFRLFRRRQEGKKWVFSIGKGLSLNQDLPWCNRDDF